jgi:hypothetical protein
MVCKVLRPLMCRQVLADKELVERSPVHYNLKRAVGYRRTDFYAGIGNVLMAWRIERVEVSSGLNSFGERG